MLLLLLHTAFQMQLLLRFICPFEILYCDDMSRMCPCQSSATRTALLRSSQLFMRCFHAIEAASAFLMTALPGFCFRNPYKATAASPREC